MNAFEQEIIWVEQLLNDRVVKDLDIHELNAPTISLEDHSTYANIVRECQLQPEERLVLALALIPHFMPHLLDLLLEINPKTGLSFTFVGGRKSSRGLRSFIPTGETAIYLLGGTDLQKRIKYYSIFDVEGNLARNKLVELLDTGNDPFLSGELSVPDSVIYKIATGKARLPRFSNSFPAELLTTKMDWNDLVLNHTTAKQLEEINTWIIHQNEMMTTWGMSKKIKPGYRAIFHGPAGTGKSLTASLLGKRTGKDVYRIDLSKVISKYIGETEKNLSNVFNEAENKNWILFFDEADALFGKRTSVNNSHDRYANQEVSYLLQRIESYNGLIILASNLKSNMDEAFMRRFQSDIYFPMPKAEERRRIWESSFSAIVSFEQELDLAKIAHDYEIAGGSIMNVVQYCSLMALKRESTEIHLEDLIYGIRKEFHKEGKVL